VPEVKQPTANGADATHDARRIRTSPRQIMALPSIIHQRRAGAIVQFSKRCAEDGTISGAHDAGVVQPVLFENFAAGRLGKACGGFPLQRRIRREKIFGACFAGSELGDDGVRGRERVPRAKITDGRVPREVMALVK